jgi:hypothetical protein
LGIAERGFAMCLHGKYFRVTGKKEKTGDVHRVSVRRSERMYRDGRRFRNCVKATYRLPDRCEGVALPNNLFFSSI